MLPPTTLPVLTGDLRTDRALLTVARILADIARNPGRADDLAPASSQARPRLGQAAPARRPASAAAPRSTAEQVPVVGHWPGNATVSPLPLPGSPHMAAW